MKNSEQLNRVLHSPSEFCIVKESGDERRRDTVDRSDQNRDCSSELERADPGMSGERQDGEGVER